MQEVELRLVANADSAVKAVKELNTETEKLGKTEAQSNKRRLGYIEAEQRRYQQLKGFRDRANSPESLKQYNKLLADSEQRLKGYESAGVKAEKQTGKLTAAFAKMAVAIIAAFSVQKIWEFIKVTAIAYDKQMQAEKKLLNALDGRERIQKRLLKQAADIQKKTIFGDEEVVQAQAFLAAQGRTEEQIKKTIRVATQLATVLGVDLQGATEMLDKTFEGTLVRLGRLDGRLKGLTTEELVSGAAIDLLDKKYQGFAETAAMTALGPMKQMQNAWVDLKETLGQVWSELLKVSGASDWAISRMQLTGKVLKDENIPWWKRWLSLYGIGTKKVMKQVKSDLLIENFDLQKTQEEAYQEQIDAYKKFLETMKELNKKETGDERLAREKKFHELSLQLQDEYEKSIIESLEGPEKLIAQRHYAMKAIQLFRDQLEEMGTLTPEQEEMFIQMGENVNKALIYGIRDTKNLLYEGITRMTGADKLRKPAAQTGTSNFWEDVFGFTPDDKEEFLNNVRETVNEFENLIQTMADNSVERARTQREALDTQIAEAQRTLEAEIELYEAGYAANVSAKRKEVEDLKKLRQKAYIDEQRAAKRQQQIETLIATVNLISAASEIFKQYSKIKFVGVALAVAMIGAMMASFVQAKSDIKSAVQLGRGGRGEVNGRLHSEGGEPFLSHVEVEDGERWGVLSRRASRKYGPVFDNMVDSFNRDKLMIPKADGTVNNVLLDTSMTNSRLERVESQLIKLNTYFEGQENIIDNGQTVIKRKGNTVRVIKK